MPKVQFQEAEYRSGRRNVASLPFTSEYYVK